VVHLARVMIALGIGSLWAIGCGGAARDDTTTDQDGGAGRGGTSGSGGASGAAGNTGGAGGSANCPDDPLNCPANCHLMYGNEYGAPGTCVTLEAVPVGCTGVAGGSGYAECFKRVRDGALFGTAQIEAFRASAAWTSCTESEKKLLSISCEAGCPDGQVATVDGCLTCAGVHDAIATRLEQARAKMTACNSDAECTCVPNDTLCAGACLVAIATTFAGDYAAEIDLTNQGYCSNPVFRGLCGFSTPRCVPCNPVCVAGRCQQAAP
jgi:hypothetical protein